MDSKGRAAVLLVGLPQLNSTLQLGVHEPLRQRIIMNYNMEGLTKEESRTYISEKLKCAVGLMFPAICGMHRQQCDCLLIGCF